MAASLSRLAWTAVVLMLALNSLLDLLPAWFSIPVGFVSVFIGLHLYLPPMLVSNIGTFVESTPVKLVSAWSGSTGYLLGTLGQGWGPAQLWYAVFFIWFASLVALATWWSRRHKDVFPEWQMRKFWERMDIEGHEKTWSIVSGLPESKLKTTQIFILRHGPIMFLFFYMTLVMALITSLEWASILFAVLAAAWPIWIVVTWMRRRRAPVTQALKEGSRDRFLQTFIAAAGLLSFKGSGGMLCIFYGTIWACLWSALSLLPNTQEVDWSIRLMWTASWLPIAAYQLYYWYSILRRYPRFLENWEGNRGVSSSVRPLPKGSYFAFLVSCYCPMMLFALGAVSSDSAKYQILYAWTGIGVCYGILLVLSVIRPTGGLTTTQSIQRDNLRIPASMLVAASGSWVFVLLLSRGAAESGLAEDLPGLVAIPFFLCLFFYIADIYRYLSGKYGYGPLADILSSFAFALAALPWLIVVFSSTASDKWRVIAWIMIGACLAGFTVVFILEAWQQHLLARGKKGKPHNLE